MFCEYSFSDSLKSVKRILRTRCGETYSRRFLLRRRAAQKADPYDCFDQVYLGRTQVLCAANGPARPVVAVDLFSGCGGLSLGAAEACGAVGRSFVVELAVDRSADSMAVYCRNIPHRRGIVADIARFLNGKLNAKTTFEERRFCRGLPNIHILLSGPPCQGNSDLNNHTRRKDSRNKLYERVARFAELTRPTHVMIENVPSVRHSRQEVLKTTTRLLTTLGYAVDFDVVDLSTIGVPQRRKRHVLLASLSMNPDIRRAVKPHAVQTARSVMWAIGDLASRSNGSIFDMPSVQTERNVARIAYLDDNGLYDLPNRLRPKCHRHGRHSYKSMYGRLYPDLPAQTITSGFGSPGQGRFVHPTERRTLTPHEAARLQFFPDSFDFSPVKHRSALAEMIGNAVPMKLSFVLCLHLLAKS